MTTETAITVGVIMLAAFMLTATVYGVWLSLSPRYARPTPIVTVVIPPTTIGQEILPIRQAREIIEASFDNKEVLD